MVKKQGIGKKQTKTKKTSKTDKGGPLDARHAESRLEPAMDAQGPVTQSNKIIICKQTGCHDISTTLGFCRFHYLMGWKKLKTKEAKKNGLELKQYLTDLARKFPEDFLERIRSEVEDAGEKERVQESDDDSDRSGLFDPMDGDEDIDTIIKGIKVEDF